MEEISRKSVQVVEHGSHSKSQSQLAAPLKMTIDNSDVGKKVLMEIPSTLAASKEAEVLSALSEIQIVQSASLKSGYASSSKANNNRSRKPKGGKNAKKTPKEKGVSIINDNNMKKKAVVKQSKTVNRFVSENSSQSNIDAKNLSHGIVVVKMDSFPLNNCPVIDKNLESKTWMYPPENVSLLEGKHPDIEVGTCQASSVNLNSPLNDLNMIPSNGKSVSDIPGLVQPIHPNSSK